MRQWCQKSKKEGRTEELYHKKRKTCTRKERDNLAKRNQRRKKWNKRISRSCRNDYRAWVTRWTEQIEKDFRAGNAKAIYEGVKALCGTKKASATKQPSLNPEKGTRINEPEELATVWKKFLAKKFSQTELEKVRDEFENLPENEGVGELEREEFERAVRHMKNGKACGSDGIPAEVYKHSAVAKEALFEFLKKVWKKEYVPPELAVGVFVMLYKKGNPDDCSNYRCICLLKHAYKILSAMLMQRLIKECKNFLSDWQAGFRAKRGCRDNIFLLRALYDFVLRGKSPCIITFIDYKAAFDSVSHKFLDSSTRFLLGRESLASAEQCFVRSIKRRKAW